MRDMNTLKIENIIGFMAPEGVFDHVTRQQARQLADEFIAHIDDGKSYVIRKEQEQRNNPHGFGVRVTNTLHISELVLCKDCDHFNDEEAYGDCDGFCDEHCGGAMSDGFCSWGERITANGGIDEVVE